MSRLLRLQILKALCGATALAVAGFYAAHPPMPLATFPAGEFEVHYMLAAGAAALVSIAVPSRWAQAVLLTFAVSALASD
ncbi:MAG: hypothetical protein ACRDFS_10660, partial [Chloroflexota bacterium]